MHYYFFNSPHEGKDAEMDAAMADCLEDMLQHQQRLSPAARQWLWPRLGRCQMKGAGCPVKAGSRAGCKAGTGPSADAGCPVGRCAKPQVQQARQQARQQMMASRATAEAGATTPEVGSYPRVVGEGSGSVAFDVLEKHDAFELIAGEEYTCAC